jgi:hypothetical protein
MADQSSYRPLTGEGLALLAFLPLVEVLVQGLELRLGLVFGGNTSERSSVVAFLALASRRSSGVAFLACLTLAFVGTFEGIMACHTDSSVGTA